MSAAARQMLHWSCYAVPAIALVAIISRGIERLRRGRSVRHVNTPA